MGEKNPFFGKRSPNWQGGITPVHAAIRNSKEMTEWRMSVFKRDSFTCQKCGARGVSLHAHHVKSFSKFPDLRFEVSNGQTLCEDCHIKTDNYAGRAIHSR